MQSEPSPHLTPRLRSLVCMASGVWILWPVLFDSAFFKVVPDQGEGMEFWEIIFQKLEERYPDGKGLRCVSAWGVY